MKKYSQKMKRCTPQTSALFSRKKLFTFTPFSFCVNQKKNTPNGFKIRFFFGQMGNL